MLQRGQVDRAGQERRVGQRLAVHPEPGHAAVRVDGQPQVRPAMAAGHRVVVRGVARGRGPGHQRRPVQRLQLGGRRVAGQRRRPRPRSPAGSCRGTRPCRRPRRARGRARPAARSRSRGPARGGGASPSRRRPCPAARSPPVAKAGGLRLDQVLLLGEQVVVGGHHAAAQPPRRQVGQVRKSGWLIARSASAAGRGRGPAAGPAGAALSEVGASGGRAARSAATTPVSRCPAYGVSLCRCTEPGRIHGELLVRRERHQVRVLARRRSRPWRSAPATRAGPAAIQRATSVSE